MTRDEPDRTRVRVRDRARPRRRAMSFGWLNTGNGGAVRTFCDAGRNEHRRTRELSVELRRIRPVALAQAGRLVSLDRARRRHASVRDRRLRSPSTPCASCRPSNCSTADSRGRRRRCSTSSRWVRAAQYGADDKLAAGYLMTELAGHRPPSADHRRALRAYRRRRRRPVHVRRTGHDDRSTGRTFCRRPR